VLSDLRVRDLGVIEDLTVELGSGMTALTGETGAGKTLLVEALGLVLGARASGDIVRAGAREALVEARFHILDEGGTERETVLARSVPAGNGRSRAWVDGRMVPVTALAELAPTLVDIHGQHDHQSLLSSSAQRRALDEFAGIDTNRLRAAVGRLRSLTEELDALGGDEGERARQLDILAFQIEELTAAGLEDLDEEQALATEEERLSDLGAHLEAAAGALIALDAEGAAPGGSAVERLAEAAGQLAGRPAFGLWEERLRSVLADITDVASDLRAVVETWEDDPVRLAEVQERRRMLRDIGRKYGGSVGGAIAFLAEAERELVVRRRAELDAATLEERRHEAVDEVAHEQDELRRARTKAAPELSAAVEGRLADLAMRGARVGISVADDGAGEPVTFLLGANAGETLRPLAKVASGGELARAMLALRLIAMGGPATMVFDEVDAGVGGGAALALGTALSQVAADRQVLVVTHLAQVAALADHQIGVAKTERGERTSTTARLLGPSERVIEIARMLSGHPDSEAAQAHARELLALGEHGGRSTTGRSPLV
jgi:DNA repair protein RecN (Recombination protein N)